MTTINSFGGNYYYKNNNLPGKTKVENDEKGPKNPQKPTQPQEPKPQEPQEPKQPEVPNDSIRARTRTVLINGQLFAVLDFPNSIGRRK